MQSNLRRVPDSNKGWQWLLTRIEGGAEENGCTASAMEEEDEVGTKNLGLYYIFYHGQIGHFTTPFGCILKYADAGRNASSQIMW